jgi:hypothetical protein
MAHALRKRLAVDGMEGIAFVSVDIATWLSLSVGLGSSIGYTWTDDTPEGVVGKLEVRRLFGAALIITDVPDICRREPGS